ncbi:MAG: hypothetical protein WA672_01550 [Candidatus Angelobacter sp.]
MFATKDKKMAAGVARKARLSPESHVIAEIAVIGRQARSSREID